VLKICKKEAMFKISDVLAVKTVDSLSRLYLLLTIVKLTLFMLLIAYKDRLWKDG
jgi:hypothetical protein